MILCPLENMRASTTRKAPAFVALILKAWGVGMLQCGMPGQCRELLLDLMLACESLLVVATLYRAFEYLAELSDITKRHQEPLRHLRFVLRSPQPTSLSISTSASCFAVAHGPRTW